MARHSLLQRWAISILATGMVLWLGWSLWVLSDREQHRGVLPVLEFGADDGWNALEGLVQLTKGELNVLRPSLRGQVLITLELPKAMRARDFRAIEVTASGAGKMPIAAIWNSSDVYYSAGAPIDWLSDSRGRVDLSGNPEWKGDVFFIGLQQFGLESPWALRSIRLIPVRLDFWSLQHYLLERLWVRGPWTFRFTNFAYPPAYGLLISPVLALMIWVLLSTGVFIFSVKEQSKKFLPILIVPWFMVWLILDLRWQVELLDKARHTWAVFGAVSVDARTSKEFDGEMVAFLDDFRDLTNELTVNRVFIVSDIPDLRMRARYHLTDLNARAVPTHVAVSMLDEHLQQDDVVIVLNSRQLKMQGVPSPLHQEQGRLVSMFHGTNSVMSGPLVIQSANFWAFKPNGKLKSQ